MQFKNLAISAFTATALAQQSLDAQDFSVLQVLQTALPSSLVAEAITNSAAVSREIASQFAAGATPSWFSGLPSDVQTYLVPQVTAITGGSNGTSSNGTVGGNNSTSNGTASTTSTRGRATITSTDDSSSETGSSGSGSQSSGAGSEGSSSESGNAAAPTAIIGAGLAGAVGLVGLLAL